MVTYLDGMWPRRQNVGHCAAVGDADARCISTAKASRCAVPMRCRSTRGGPCTNRPLRAPTASTTVGALYRDRTRLARRQLAVGPAAGRHPRRSLPRQRLLSRRQIVRTDRFYFACNDALVYDLAICVNAWCFEQDASFNITKGGAMIENYRRRRPLSAAEVEAFPARGARDDTFC